MLTTTLAKSKRESASKCKFTDPGKLNEECAVAVKYYKVDINVIRTDNAA